MIKVIYLYRKYLLMQTLQLASLHPIYDQLQSKFWDSKFSPIYGGGCTQNPELCFVFMNPTARNVSSNLERKGLKAPRIGTKQTRKMFYDLWLLSEKLFQKTRIHPSEWTEEFAVELYTYFKEQKIFITNLAKCTQADAHALKDSVFKEYLPYMHEELFLLNPKHIITFWNQVSSVLLQKPISVSQYQGDVHEELKIWSSDFRVYPCRYPVGQGYRNIEKAKERIQSILSKK